MRLALNSLILAGPPSFEEQLAIARDTGYEGIDTPIGQLLELDDPRELFDRYGVEPAAWGMSARWQDDEAVFAADLEQLAGVAQVAQAIGCPRCMTWMPPTTDGDPAAKRAQMVERFRRVGEVLSEYDVRFGLEWIGPWHARQGGNIVLYTLPDTLQLLDDIGMPNVGLMLDSWHWFMAGGTLCELRELRAEQIVHVHFVDAPDRPYEEQRDNERAIPGEGIINMVGFVRALDEIGYADFGSVEIFGQDLPKLPPLEAARKVKAACDAVLAEARA